jgi:membrane associated rhomboid family serine protease
MMNHPLPPVVKNLLIVNVLMLLVSSYLPYLVELPGPSLYSMLSLFYFQSDFFRPHQLVTHIFMHADFLHLLGNMLGLIIFGPLLEQVWGSKRFLTFYMITGLGAAFLHMGFNHWEMIQMQQSIMEFAASPDPDSYLMALRQDFNVDRQSEFFDIQESFAAEWSDNQGSALYPAQAMSMLNTIYYASFNGPMLGASGAIFGLLAAFGLMFPQLEIRPMFFPVPIKAIFLVLMFTGVEIYSVMKNNPGDHVAHFAHLGGALFGFILVKLWSKDRSHL